MLRGGAMEVQLRAQVLMLYNWTDAELDSFELSNSEVNVRG